MYVKEFMELVDPDRVMINRKYFFTNHPDNPVNQKTIKSIGKLNHSKITEKNTIIFDDSIEIWDR